MLKWIVRGTAVLLALVVLLLAAAWFALRGSLPELEGELALPGLSAPVTIQRDAHGLVTIDAANEADAARALGFVHAQERYFEMDLVRRSAAGELAALVGPMALPLDRQRRVHRLRARIDASLDVIAGPRLPVLEAYADGANAGLDALGARPWPYLLLRQSPEAWTPADTALAGYAMFFDLQDAANQGEYSRHHVRDALPPALAALLAHDGSRWDAPLMGEPRGDAVLPGPEAVDLRALPSPDGAATGVTASEGIVPGSNNFAVDGSLTTDGRAIVADDMHLGLRAPNLWFRARLRYAHPGAPGGRVDVSGVTLPGVPFVIVGANTHVAWGFTNSYGDWADWLVVPAGAPTVAHEEVLAVAGGEPERFLVEEVALPGGATAPVLRDEPDGTRLALQWVAHRPGSLDLALGDMATAGDLDAALAVAARAGVPAQNLVAGDARGRIGWRIAGRIPARPAGCDGRAPAPLECAWPGFLAPAATLALQIADPADGRLWTANARVTDGEALALMGDGGVDLGARQQQIRDALRARDTFTEADLLAIQLDDRALFLERWWTLLQQVVAAHPDDAALQALVRDTRWTGRASVDSAAYRITRAFRGKVGDEVVAALTAPGRAALGEAWTPLPLNQREGIVWPLIEQRPAHLLGQRHADWDALLAESARWVAREMAAQAVANGEAADGDAALATLPRRTWGERNTTAICHPLAGALPGPLRERLCMPAEALPGDGNMPRVQAPAFGASQRMVVSPGREAEGLLHMPGGQAGHPLSPYWGAGHADWARGTPSPFLPGEAAWTLELTPGVAE